LKKKILSSAMAALLIVSSLSISACGGGELAKTSTKPSVTATRPTPAVTSSKPVESSGSASVIINKPGEKHSVTLNDEVTVIIPVNTLPEGTKIEINSIRQPKVHEFDGFVPINQYEITSSSGGELGGEVEIEFAYDPSVLDEELEISHQLAVAYYDEEYGAWQEVDFTVNENASTLAVKTSHFSLWSLFGFDSKWVTSTLPGPSAST
jgi:hypothetical protein